MKTIYVNCPFCEGMVEVDPETGDVLNKWSHAERSGKDGDKMAAALKKLEEDKKKRATLFNQTKEGMESQKKKLENAFKDEVERLKKEGIKEKPITPFDLD